MSSWQRDSQEAPSPMLRNDPRKFRTEPPGDKGYSPYEDAAPPGGPGYRPPARGAAAEMPYSPRRQQQRQDASGRYMQAPQRRPSYARDMSPSALDITQPQVADNMALEVRIQEMSRDLAKERERCARLESRAAEAESIAVWLKEELDSAMAEKPDEVIRGDDLDCTRRVERRDPALLQGGQLSPKSPTSPQPMTPKRRHSGGGASEDRDTDSASFPHDELRDTRTLAKPHALANLEEENLRLREELNSEKKKVIDLKRHASAHVEEFEKVCADVELSQWLQNEVNILRGETARYRDDLNVAGQREDALKHEVVALTRQLDRFRRCGNNPLEPDEMDTLIQNMSNHLLEVERELSEQTHNLADISGPFLDAALNELARLRCACQKIDAARGSRREPPPLFDRGSRDVRLKLRMIVDFMQYVYKVIDPGRGATVKSGGGVIA